MEDTKVSNEYLKAYNQADMICTYMPHLIPTIEIQVNEPGDDYTRGFDDRLRQFEKEQEAVKNFSFETEENFSRNIDVSLLDKGTYILRLTNGSKVGTKIFVVQ